MKNKKIIVTGGAGFIGSHIVEELAKLDARLIVIDNESSGLRSNLKEAEKILNEKNKKLIYYKVDITDFNNLKKIFEELSKDSPIDIIFHEGAMVSVPGSIDNPKTCFNINVEGTLNLLVLARDFKVKRFLFASSAAVYGETKKLPISENNETITLSPYGLSKQIGEELLRQFYELYGLETISIRYFNVFGERQSSIGSYVSAIPIFINKMIKNEKPIVFGDGKQTRDFVYVKNIVEGNIFLANQPKEKVAGKIFNLANGKKINILDLIKDINLLLNKDIKPEFKEKRQGDILDSYADISKIKNLGYNPKINFIDSLKNTIEYYKNKSN